MVSEKATILVCVCVKDSILFIVDIHYFSASPEITVLKSHLFFCLVVLSLLPWHLGPRETSKDDCRWFPSALVVGFHHTALREWHPAEFPRNDPPGSPQLGGWLGYTTWLT